MINSPVSLWKLQKLKIYLQCLHAWYRRDVCCDGFEEDSEVVHERPDKEVELGAMPQEDEDKRDEWGEDLSHEAVPGTSQRYIDVPVKNNNKYICVAPWI